MNTISSLSLFFPVYNEIAVLETTVSEAHQVLVRLGIGDFEIIIIDDGSTDGSGALADGLAARLDHVRVVHHSRNLGYGAALSSGFSAATREWVMYTDSDGQFKLNDLKRLLPYTAQYDVILGYRDNRQDHIGRVINAWVWTMLVWVVMGLRVRDLDCGFKLFRRQVLHEVLPLSSRGAVISAELLAKLQRQNHRYVQVRVRHYPRRFGQPSGASVRVIWRALGELRHLRDTLNAN